MKVRCKHSAELAFDRSEIEDLLEVAARDVVVGIGNEFGTQRDNKVVFWDSHGEPVDVDSATFMVAVGVGLADVRLSKPKQEEGQAG